MKDSEILSVFHDQPTGGAIEAVGALPARLVFDACHVGVVLRAVLFVQVAVSIGAMFASIDVLDWLARWAFAAGGSLPATLVWLIVACAFKRLLGRLSAFMQWTAGVLLGAAAGLYGCGLLSLVGTGPSPWIGSGCLGAALAALLVAGLVLRAKGSTPATTEARLADLQSRIRPHFLFNTLNSAIALVRAEPARAEAMLEDLSELFRQVLAEQADSVSLAQELALARRYLAIEQVRFGSRLQLAWSLDPAADQARLPPLLLQPLVENAVRHGVEPSQQGAHLQISTRRKGDSVVIKITNSVPAGQGAPGWGVALANVRERLALLHDLQGQFQSGLKGDVYQVRIEVPA